MSDNPSGIVQSLSKAQLIAVGVVGVIVLAGGVFLLQSVASGPGAGGQAKDVEPIYDVPLSSRNVTAGHTSAIETSGTVTYTRHKEIVSAGVSFQNSTTTEQYNLKTDAKLITRSVGGAELAGYSTNESSYIRLKQADGTVSYSQGPEYGKLNSPLALALDQHRPDNLGFGVLEAANLSYLNKKTLDGQSVFVYGATGESQFDKRRLPGGFDSLTTARLRIEITESGLVRRYEYEFEDTNGDLDRRTLSLTVSNAGSTQFSAPSWVSDAKASTGS